MAKEQVQRPEAGGPTTFWRNCTNLEHRPVALQETVGKRENASVWELLLIPLSRCSKTMDELRKESATLRTEIRVNCQTLEMQDYRAGTVHCLRGSHREK